MQYSPLITIAVPVYNGENYLEEALNSIFKQTYENFEIIVVDDGSNNETAIRAIAAKFDDPRIIFFQKKNGGVASALNLVIQKMNGEFLAWLSHDDLFNSEKLSIQVKALSECNPNLDILFSNYDLINEHGKKTGEVDFTNQVLNCRRLGGLERGLINGCTVLISKSILSEVGMFDETLRYTQDYDYWLRCLAAGKRFKHIPKSLVRTRQHPNQDTNKNRVPVKKESEELWLQLSNYWLSQSPKSLQLDLREILEFRIFLQDNGFSLAEQNLNSALLSKISCLKVSVVIPVADRPFLLSFALKSLRSQLHSNLEVVIVDDSPGSTIDISQMVDSQDFSVKYIRNEINLGAGQSRNVGMNASDGEYICFLDSDDFFLPDKIFEQLTHMIAFDSEISHTSYFSRDRMDHSYQYHDTSRHSGWNQAAFIAGHGCTIATPTVMIKSSLLGSLENPFPHLRAAGEDIAAWFKLLHYVTSPLLHIELPLTVVTLHANSAAKSSIAQLESQANIQQAISDIGLQVNSPMPQILKKKSFISIFSKNLNSKLSNIVIITFFKLPKKTREKIKNSCILRPLQKRFREKYL
ncbi:Glyco_tranf_GTA_type domain containing protein [Candidatus Nanopelagicaceae bacterium]